MPVGFFYLLLLVLVAVTVVLLIQVVGLILVLALLTLPAAVAGHYVHSLGRMMLIATLLGAVLSMVEPHVDDTGRCTWPATIRRTCG